MSILSAVRTVVALAALCASVACQVPAAPRPTALPTEGPYIARITSDEFRTSGASLFSDDEFRAMALKVTTRNDFTRYPAPPVTIAWQMQVQVLKFEAIALSEGGGAATPMDFARVRVLEGPAKDREGWISAVALGARVKN